MSSQQIVIAAAGNTGSAPAPAATGVEEVFSATTYVGYASERQVINNVALASTASWSSIYSYGTSTTGAIGGWFKDVFSDASSNIYLAGDFDTPTVNNVAQISKYNSSNVLQWQRSLANGNASPYGVVANSSGDVYVSGEASGILRGFVAKYNSSGVLQWQRQVVDATTTRRRLRGLALDSSGNVLVVGSFNDGTRIVAAVLKYDASGTLLWQRKLYDTNTTSEAYRVAVDSSNNVLVSSILQDATRTYLSVVKYNSSGVLQWQRKLYNSTNVPQDCGIDVDSSGNVYFQVLFNTTPAQAIVGKYNSSGVLQWAKRLNNSSNSSGVSVDSSGAVYVAGEWDGTNYGTYVAKFDTSGTFQWTRSFHDTNTDSYGVSITFPNVFVGSNGKVYVCGDRNSPNGGFVAIIPSDGSATSGVAAIALDTLGPIDSTATYTEAAGTATDAAGTATSATGTLTDSAGVAASGSYVQAAVTGKGGMVWMKGRTLTTDYALYDTVRGVQQQISSNLTNAQSTNSTGALAFYANGFALGASATVNGADNYISWTFAENQNFFDVQTKSHTTGSASTVSLSTLGTVGCVMVKRTDSTGGDWYVWHRSLTASNNIFLNSSNAQFSVNAYLSVSGTTLTIASGMPTGTYVVYAYAHNTATGSFIQCGSYAGNGSSSGPVVTLGWEPQWLLMKNISAAATPWVLFDSARGLYNGTVDYLLAPNLTNAEGSVDAVSPMATGFQVVTTTASYNASGNTYIYIAVRRGPMNQPTAGTDVVGFSAYTGTGVARSITTDPPELVEPDLALIKNRGATGGTVWASRLTANLYMLSSAAATETSSATVLQTNPWDSNYYVKIGTTGSTVNASTNTYIAWIFKRYPKVFDVVCYNGTGANTTVSHNLTVAPELIIAKRRNGPDSWAVGATVLGWGNILLLNASTISAAGATTWNSTAPTASVFSVGTSTTTNDAGSPYVAWMFATLAGVSKVGSYTGNGTSQTINCGFATGARLVIIKRTSVATGDWYIWDSKRGIVAGIDPRLSLNTTASEVNTPDDVDADPSGFIVNQVGGASGGNINVSGSTYLFIALA